MTTIKLTQQEYRKTQPKPNRPAATALANVTGRNERLKPHGWSDQELGRIPNEALAKLAYAESVMLPKEFSSCETFLAHWRGLRRKLGAPASPVYAKTHGQVRGDETRPLGQQIKQAWDTSPGLRAEFADSFSAYCAFKRAESRSGIRVVVGRVTGPQSKCA